ncbi:MAG: hypothetical protein AAB781_00045 [Patescibacteria group bacterium]
MGNEQTAPSDVVIIILSLLGEGNKIPADNKFLYNKFFELSQDSDFYLLFQDFIFNASATYPYCEAVEIAVSRITKFGLVEWKTLESDYTILPTLVSRGKRLMQLFSAGDRIKLGKASEKFKAMTKEHYKNSREG